jgi:TRAP transporter TAXI family solute receptor
VVATIEAIASAKPAPPVHRIRGDPMRQPLCRPLQQHWRPAAILATAGIALFLTSTSPSARAQQIKLPPNLTMTAYDTGSSGFNIAVAVGKALKDKHGTDVRVLPAGNDVARLAPLKAGRAQASAMGVGVYYAQEGVFEFASRDWGPQPLRLILASTDCNAVSLGVARDTGVKEVKDLKGKRIGMVVGSPALNQNAFAVLAYADIKPADVTLVEFSSYGAMWKGIVNNEVDAAIASTISGQAKEAEASPRGLMYPPTPAGDTAAWARVRKVAPYYVPHKTTCGPGLSADSALELPSYPYPIFMAYASQPTELIANLAGAMIEDYAAYKDGAPGAAGLELSRQNLAWVLPYHDGAVEAIRKAGAWKPEHQAHNDRLVKRQQVLAEAWGAFLKTNPAGDDAAVRKAWMGARAKALAAAGMDVIFEQ